MTSAEVVKQIVKWFVIPVAMAAIGYFLVGPQIGNAPVIQTSAAKVKDIVAPPEDVEEPESESGGTGKFKSVSLDINVSKDDSEPKKKSSSRSTTTSTRDSKYFKPESESPASPEPDPVDE